MTSTDLSTHTRLVNRVLNYHHSYVQGTPKCKNIGSLTFIALHVYHTSEDNNFCFQNYSYNFVVNILHLRLIEVTRVLFEKGNINIPYFVTSKCQFFKKDVYSPDVRYRCNDIIFKVPIYLYFGVPQTYKWQELKLCLPKWYEYRGLSNEVPHDLYHYHYVWNLQTSSKRLS